MAPTKRYRDPSMKRTPESDLFLPGRYFLACEHPVLPVRKNHEDGNEFQERRRSSPLAEILSPLCSIIRVWPLESDVVARHSDLQERENSRRLQDGERRICKPVLKMDVEGTLCEVYPDEVLSNVVKHEGVEVPCFVTTFTKECASWDSRSRSVPFPDEGRSPCPVPPARGTDAAKASGGGTDPRQQGVHPGPTLDMASGQLMAQKPDRRPHGLPPRNRKMVSELSTQIATGGAGTRSLLLPGKHSSKRGNSGGTPRSPAGEGGVSAQTPVTLSPATESAFSASTLRDGDLGDRGDLGELELVLGGVDEGREIDLSLASSNTEDACSGRYSKALRSGNKRAEESQACAPTMPKRSKSHQRTSR